MTSPSDRPGGELPPLPSLLACCRRHPAVLLAVALLASCASAPPAVPTTQDSGAPTVQGPSPLDTRLLGKREARAATTASLQATAQLQTQGHRFLAAPLPPALARVCTRINAIAMDLPGRHARATTHCREDASLLLVRLVGTEAPPEPLRLTVFHDETSLEDSRVYGSPHDPERDYHGEGNAQWFDDPRPSDTEGIEEVSPEGADEEQGEVALEEQGSPEQPHGDAAGEEGVAGTLPELSRELKAVRVASALEVVGGAKAPQEAALDTTFYRALGKTLLRGRWASAEDVNDSPLVPWSIFDSNLPPFYTFAAMRLALQFGRAQDHPMRSQPPSDRLLQRMRLFAGWTAVEEALQVERALMMRSEASKERTKSLASVKALTIEDHPWETMLAELAREGRTPSVEPLARHIPGDMAYVRMTGWTALSSLATNVRRIVDPLASVSGGQSSELGLVDNWLTTLGLDPAQGFEDAANARAPMALVLADPYVGQSPAMALVFEPKDRASLQALLDRHEQALAKRVGELNTSTVEVEGKSVRAVVSADGQVSQYRMELGSRVILASTPGVLTRFVALERAPKTNLADRGDFRYLRALYPWSEGGEEAFVFISDGFVREATSPALRIAQARREDARADLEAVNHAAMLFGWLEGRLPKDEDELVQSGWLKAPELAHADGSPIGFEPETGATSAWGSVASPAPLEAHPVTQVSAAEIEAYGRFRDNYQRSWSAYVDPIGMQFTRTEADGPLQMHAHMLPLVDASEYRRLARQIGAGEPGDGAVEFSRLPQGLLWTLGVGSKSPLRREFNDMAQGMTGRTDVALDWLGGWVGAGMLDGPALWELAVASGQVPSADLLGRQSTEELLPIVARLPVFAAAEVRNPLALGVTLTALRALAESSAPGMLVWGQDPPYRDIAITTIGAGRELGSSANPDAWEALRLRYALAGGVLILALDRPTMEKLIDQSLDGGLLTTPTAKDAQARPGHIQSALEVSTASGQSAMRLVFAAMLERLAQEQFTRARANWIAVREATGARDTTAAPQSPLARQARALLGHVPADPHGAPFRIDGHGQLLHPIYGHGSPTVVPGLPVGGSPLHGALEAVTRMRLGLGFVGSGAHRGLHTRMVLEQAPAGAKTDAAKSEDSKP